MAQPTRVGDFRARHVLAVGSGKGGVGKSTVALNLAIALTNRGSVGLLDLDLYGPNQPLMVGLRRSKWTHAWTLAGPLGPTPIRTASAFGLTIASTSMIFGDDQPLGLAGRDIESVAAQLFTAVTRNPLDYLVVDLPPGTAVTQHVLLRATEVRAAILVVTPQEVAHLDAKKSLRLFNHAKIPVLGAIENMAGVQCPHCGNAFDLFPVAAVPGTVWSLGVPRLLSLPMLPLLATLAETGEPLLVARPDHEASVAIKLLASSIASRLERYTGV